MKKIMLVMALALMSAVQMNAQTTKASDKDIIGVWTLEYMQYDGEKKMPCGKGQKYTSFKYYGADGEYACCEIALTTKGTVRLMPHEYGKYTYKNGVYSEMGRPALKAEDMKMTDKTHFHCRWMNRIEGWKKTQMSDKAARYIVESCKQKEMPADIQKQLKELLF